MSCASSTITWSKGDGCAQRLVGAVRLEPALDPLQAQVVFFVDHDAEHLAAPESHAARAFAGGKLARDQVALDQHVALHFFELIEVKRHHAALQVDLLDRLLAQLHHVGALLLGRFKRERKTLDVARKAHARADHDVAVGPAAFQPFAQHVREMLEGGVAQACFSPAAAPSRSLISSRSLAASS
jgi:hypothetical protein